MRQCGVDAGQPVFRVAILDIVDDLALERVNALTPAELAALESQIQDLPAGGSLLGTLGIVLIVLIVLDLVGVTDVFSQL